MRNLLIAMLGVAALVAWGTAAQPASDPDVVTAANGDAAFRDGLYLGRQMGEQRGATPRLVVGRWSNEADRRSFTRGYQLGFSLARGGGPIVIAEAAEQRGYGEGLREGAQARQHRRPVHLQVNYSRAGATQDERSAFARGYASGYHLAYYGEQQVASALVISPATWRD